jgi:hypothetical protein
MHINNPDWASKTLVVLKGIYWAWLILCFMLWLFLALGVVGLDSFFNIFEFVLDNRFGKILFPSSLFLPVIFIIVSIIRRKVLIWELGVITLMWGLMFYVLPHFPG